MLYQCNYEINDIINSLTEVFNVEGGGGLFKIISYIILTQIYHAINEKKMEFVSQYK